MDQRHTTSGNRTCYILNATAKLAKFHPFIFAQLDTSQSWCVQHQSYTVDCNKDFLIADNLCLEDPLVPPTFLQSNSRLLFHKLNLFKADQASVHLLVTLRTRQSTLCMFSSATPLLKHQLGQVIKHHSSQVKTDPPELQKTLELSQNNPGSNWTLRSMTLTSTHLFSPLINTGFGWQIQSPCAFHPTDWTVLLTTSESSSNRSKMKTHYKLRLFLNQPSDPQGSARHKWWITVFKTQENKTLQPQPDTISFANPIHLLVHFVLIEKMQNHLFRKNSGEHRSQKSWSSF